jgi:hypothetical protein
LLEEYLEPFSSDISAVNAEKRTSMYRARNKPQTTMTTRS